MSYENADGTGTVTADKLLMSVGPSSGDKKGFGLENLNLEWTDADASKVDEHCNLLSPRCLCMR